MKTENGKTTYSAPCGMKGCIDYNKKITEAIAEYNQQEGTGFDAMNPRDVACFILGDGILGKMESIDCGCEIRGGGDLVCPLHIHYCERHGGNPKDWESYWDALHAIAVALTEAGYKATLEGGGAAIPFVGVRMSDGRVIHLGNLSQTWGGAIYANDEAAATGDEQDGFALAVPASDMDAARIVEAFTMMVIE